MLVTVQFSQHLFYPSFFIAFYPTAYKAERAESIPIVIVDEEQSLLTSQVIGQTANSPHVKIVDVTANFLEAEQMVREQKPMVFYFYQAI